MRLCFEIDKGIGGELEVTADFARADSEGRAALLHLVMCQTADAHEAAAYLGLRSIRSVRRDRRFPKPLMVGDEFRWLRADLDAYADASLVAKRQGPIS
jgi:hypothetical protein